MVVLGTAAKGAGSRGTRQRHFRPPTDRCSARADLPVTRQQRARGPLMEHDKPRVRAPPHAVVRLRHPQQQPNACHRCGLITSKAGGSFTPKPVGCSSRSPLMGGVCNLNSGTAGNRPGVPGSGPAASCGMSSRQGFQIIPESGKPYALSKRGLVFTSAGMRTRILKLWQESFRVSCSTRTPT